MAVQPPYDRRRFLVRALESAAGAAGASYLLTGCGKEPSKATSGVFGENGPGDIMIRQVGVLPKEVLANNQAFTLFFREPYHKHALILSPADLAQLRRGHALQRTTEEASGHTHSVSIDPNQRPTFEVKAVHAYVRGKEDPKVRVATITKEQVLSAASVKLTASGEGLPEQQIILSVPDLCALRGGVAVTTPADNESGEGESTLVFDPRFEP